MNVTAKKYLTLLNPLELLKTKKVLNVNPTLEYNRAELKQSILCLRTYNVDSIDCYENISLDDIEQKITPTKNNWLNIDIVNLNIVEHLATIFNIHSLIVEDILSINQRPKIDEIDNHIYCVLQMMYYNSAEQSIENEQISFVLGSDFLLSFQDDEVRDYFDTIRQKLNIATSKSRIYTIDYLLYSLLDCIVDNYYLVMDKLGENIEKLEETVSKGQGDNFTMNRINSLRKEIILYRRNIVPVKDLILGLLNTDNDLIKKNHKRYFKDVYDHISQAIELSENYRDVVTNIRDLYINQVNLKSNEVMKFLTILTSLLAPATVIGGIFGMNFDKDFPILHSSHGFWVAVGLMILLPLLMLIWFRKKKWF